MELKPITKPVITESQLVAYADASRDWNPIHTDKKFAEQMGFPNVIAHGMLSMAFMADFVSLHFPKKSFKVNKLRTRFRRVIFPGDIVTCGGKIEEENNGHFKVSLWLKNQNDETAVDGRCEITKLS